MPTAFEVSNHKWTALARGPGRGGAQRLQVRRQRRRQQHHLTLLKSALMPDMAADKACISFTYCLLAWNGSLADSALRREAYDLNARS